MTTARAPRAILVLCSALAFSSCKEAPSASSWPPPLDAGPQLIPAPPVPVLLPDAGNDALQAAQAALKANQIKVPLRLELIADLASTSLLGVAPGDPASSLEARLGSPGLARGEVVRWPMAGVEAVIHEGRVMRLALHASRVESDPQMNVFVGEVLVGAAPLTQLAPDLTIKQVLPALGAGGRIEKSAEVTEAAWRRGPSTLYLTFDNRTLQLEAIVLEPFLAQIWDGMKPLEAAKELWQVEPSGVTPNTVAFAQLAAPMTLAEAMDLRLIAGHLPGADRLFGTLQAKFLARGESLRRIDGRRAALLRSDGCTYLVRELEGGLWEARNPGVECDPEREPEGLTRLQRLFVAPEK